jgi:hypothetical protein
MDRLLPSVFSAASLVCAIRRAADLLQLFAA